MRSLCSPDAAGEDKKVHTAEESDVCPDYLAYRNGKDIQSKSGLQVVGAGTFFQHLHITLAGRESTQAALMVEQIFKFVGAELLIAQEIEEDARVKIAGACTHRDAAGRSEAHGGVDRYSVAKGAQAGSVSEVRQDGSFGKLRAEVMHQGFIRKTVETIASNSCVEVALGEG